MSTIDNSGIDETKPAEVQATTQSVRDNFSAIKTQLGNANTDVTALENGIADLSGVTSPGTARNNLSVYSTTQTDALVDDLSGVTDTAAARTNLDVYSKAETVALHGRRNAVINGGLDVNQRGFTTQSSIPNFSFTYFADRHRLYNDNGTGSVDLSRSTDVPSGEGFSTSVNVTVNTALASPGTGNELVIAYNIEGYDYRALEASGYLTASFWVKSNKTGIYSYSLKNTGADRVYVTEFTVDAADTWEKKTITIPLDYSGGTWNYTNGVGLISIITLMTNSGLHASSNDTWITLNTPASANQVNFMDTVGNVFKMTGLQIEPGQVATPFEHRPYGEELALCQRYYENSYKPGQTVGASDIVGSVSCVAHSTTQTTGCDFKVEKRTNSPTVTVYSTVGTQNKVTPLNGGADIGTNVTVDILAPNCILRCVDSGGGFTAGTCYRFHYVVDAEL